MKRSIALLLVLVIAFTLTACDGAKDNDPNLGKYVGATVEVFGEDVNISEIYPEGENYIELRSDGKCVFTLDGDSESGNWTLNGNDIVLTIEDVDSTGTLRDGVLTIDFMGEGITMTFVKDGANVKTDASSKPTDEPTDEPDGNELEGNVTVVADAEYDYNKKGAIFFSYPSDIFLFDDSFGIGALETADGELRMTFYANPTQEEFRTTLGNLDSYSDYEDFTMQDVMIAGYKTVQITYNCWGDYYVDTYIDFGEDAGEYAGICISVRSYNSFEECRSAAVEAVLYSIQVVN